MSYPTIDPIIVDNLLTAGSNVAGNSLKILTHIIIEIIKFIGFGVLVTLGIGYIQSVKKEKKILKVIERALGLQLERLNVNEKLLLEEKKLIKKNQRLIEPVTSIQTNILDLLLSVHIPEKLLNNPELFRKIMNTMHNNNEINALIYNREQHIVGNLALSNFLKYLEIIDEKLLQKLHTQIMEMFRLLGEIQKCSISFWDKTKKFIQTFKFPIK